MPPKYKFRAADVLKSGKVREDVLEILRKWCDEYLLIGLTDEQLILFLLSANSLPEAKEIIYKYFKCRKNAPEIFSNMNVRNEDVVQALDVYSMGVIPERTTSNEVVVFGRLKDRYYRKFHLHQLFRLVFMVMEFCLYEYPSDGVIVVIDMEGVGFMHLTRVRLGIIQKFFQYVQEGLPWRIKQIHILNTVSFIDKILFILKPFLTEELFNAIQFHPRGYDLSNDLPKKLLPEDYDGHLQPLETLSKRTFEQLHKLGDLYAELEEQIANFNLNNNVVKF